ncbi:MAG: zinc ribbon domain-containing protein [Phycisphaerae bacterium]
MPVYEYACSNCEHEFENLVRTVAGGRRHPPCPSCGSRSVVRRPSVFAAREGGSKLRCSPYSGECDRCGDAAGPCSV